MLQGAFTAGKCYLTPGIGVVFEEQRKYFPGDLFKRYRAERLKILLDSHRWWQGLCCSVPRAHLFFHLVPWHQDYLRMHFAVLLSPNEAYSALSADEAQCLLCSSLKIITYLKKKQLLNGGSS